MTSVSDFDNLYRMSERTEFGYPRSQCGCHECQLNCCYMPGFLIPSDIPRMMPLEADPFRWAMDNLLASPGALAVKNGQMFRIPTLVPAVKKNGTCKNLIAGKCAIHAVAPFGCAFFSCKDTERGSAPLAQQGLMAVVEAWQNIDLYAHLWAYLAYEGKVSECASILRERMRVLA